jgi:hypothetical protein
MADFDPANRQALNINVKAVVDQIIDGYRVLEPRASHWVQKDGIQNCWDARKEKENRNNTWKCEIELIEKDGHTIVTITDFGTWGLTGRRLSAKELAKPKIDPIHRYSRFENYAYANDNVKNQHLLGSRGRGKFVFHGASKNMEIMWETLRDDKKYWLGGRVVSLLIPDNDFAVEDKAKNILVDKTKGLVKPLTHVGSRIIIIDPVKEVVDDIADGTMERFISETWWEIIDKFGAKIVVKSRGKSVTVKSFAASLPCSLMTTSKISRPKTSKEQEVLVKESIPIPDSKYRIKKLYLLYDPNRTFDDRQRGISIQRDGMSICHHNTEQLGDDLSEHITGFVIFEGKFEEEMRQKEGLEHYSYNFATKPTKGVGYILKKLYREFAKKQLGWNEGQTAKAKKSDKKANDRARNQANKIAKKIIGTGKGSTKTKTRTKQKKKTKKNPLPVEIQLNDLGFPDPEIERVDYKQSLTGIGARVLNNTDRDLKFGIKIEVRSIERDVQVLGKFLFDGEVSVKKRNAIDDPTVSPYCCNESIKIEKSHFTPGHYKINAQLVALTPFGKYKKSAIVDQSRKSFFVEVDPPEMGLWESFVAVDFSTFTGDDITRKAYHRDGSRLGSYTLCYNPEHAEHKKIKDTDTNGVAQYRYKLTIPELIILDYENEWGVVFSDEDRKDPMRMLTVQKDTLDKYTDSKYLGEV